MGFKAIRTSFCWLNAGLILGFTLSYIFIQSMDEIVGNSSIQGKVEYDEHGEIEGVINVDLSPDVNKTKQKNFKTVRILCWVMTHPKNLNIRLVHVKATWGKRCDKLLFFSSEPDENFPIIKVPVPTEDRSHLTLKSRQAWFYVFQNHLDDADWFYRCDDDSYAIMDNMRYFLSDYDPENPYYFGHMFKTLGGYSSGGSGYVISRESLKRFGDEGFNSPKCRKDGSASDQAIGACLQLLGVKIGDSRDQNGRSRFHCFTPETHILGIYPDWYYKYDMFGAQKGLESMSDYPISFHYVSGQHMHTLDYFLYKVKVYGEFIRNEER